MPIRTKVAPISSRGSSVDQLSDQEVHRRARKLLKKMRHGGIHARKMSKNNPIGSMDVRLGKLEQLRSEAKEALPKHYLKTCNQDNVGKNIDYFKSKKGFPHKQAVAASLSTLRRSCGVKSK